MELFQVILKQLREQHGLSQAALAKKLDVGQSTVGMWENGKNKPEYGTLIKIADFFGVSVDYLTGKSDTSDAQPDEMAELLQELKDDPDRKMLFSLSKKASTEDVKTMVRFLEGIIKTKDDE